MKTWVLVLWSVGALITGLLVCLKPVQLVRVGQAHPQSGLPNSSLTPGIVNPDITQANIGQTLCSPNWSTKSIRPPVSYTTPLKKRQIAQYGYRDTNTADYEEDHLISLELGGSPADPKNLWPEPYNLQYGARQKDKVENYLHNQVCAGNISLSDAQYQISHDWIAVYQQISE